MDPHERAILRACGKHHSDGGFRASGHWVMREDVNPAGTRDFGGPRVPCAVLDAASQGMDLKTYHTWPKILASGDTWEAVHAALVAAGEMRG